ncbi:uncharacterized protein L969DRAFT_92808 [Mixia osmundae IAM 14324]|uniref:Replication factor C subunit 5 n=1 Tax=Mixia osmundae (strain CBS 9802 / IAM 14324 / JCM 22182 / KY 12970) TaxID=764103 RepID=G7DYM2_MIXOS|nr:uncharacterized protein L969DRAFT_92808 [Mixia osmundae IAM 14324]KEI41581.1 hypothetical protein L969DRAFT_92808 [Mixia osmundae IAM 14324]GAA95682.1 hypothetical protein E5Q_02339 [Mixia osmundae IAM 14324]
MSGAVAGALRISIPFETRPRSRAGGQMSLFVDKYRPKQLNDLHYHHDLSRRIQALAESGQDFPHLLFYGPSGAGKKTRIMCTLRELYGSSAEKLRIDQRVFVTPSRRKLDVNVVQSNYHIELTPSDVGMYDRSVVQEILKEIAQTQQVDVNAKKRFKVVVINEADLLSRDAQSALRRTMEKYTTNLRLILCANSTSKIIGPIRSRCLLLRVGAPTDDEMVNVINHVAKKERFEIPRSAALAVAQSASGNLRRALLALEALHTQDPTFQSASVAGKATSKIVPMPDWEEYCGKVTSTILTSQTPQQLLAVRQMLYELLVHCITPQLILSTITRNLVERADEALKPEIVHWAAFYDHRLKLGTKPIFHLEAFVAKVMSLWKSHLAGYLD